MKLNRKFAHAALAFAVALLSVSACGDEAGNPSVRGDYALRTVNGAPLPYVTTDASGVKTELLDDVFSLYSGSTFAEVIHVRVTTNGAATTQTITETGTYGGQGTGLLFSYNSGKPARQSVFNNRTLSFLEGGVTRIYVKP
jgi:hypothetical protein